MQSGLIEQGVFNSECYGKQPGLEIVEYAGMSRASKQQKQSFVIEQISTAGRCRLAIHYGIATVLSAKTNVKERERSMEFIGFYIFKCHHGDEIRLKHYAGILVI